MTFGKGLSAQVADYLLWQHELNLSDQRGLNSQKRAMIDRVGRCCDLLPLSQGFGLLVVMISASCPGWAGQ